MRLLIYGMQSSGASTFTLVLAQRPRSIAFLDIWSMFAAPELETEVDVVAKAVVTTAYPLEIHKRRLRPDATILFLRHPLDVYDSLIRKSYVNHDGLVDEKLVVLEQTFDRPGTYDRIVYYEDFLFSPSRTTAIAAELGWTLPDDLDIGRRQAEIVAFNEEHLPGIGLRLKYGAGNHKPGLAPLGRLKLKRADDPSLPKLRALCPRLFAHYEETMRARAAEWDVAEPPVLACDVSHLVARLCPAPSQPLLDRYRLIVGGGLFVKDVSDEHLVVAGHGGGTITLTALPGAPFNRLTGTVSLHRRMGPTDIAVRVSDGSGAPIGRQDFALRLGDRRTIRIDFGEAAGPLDLAFDMRPADAGATGVFEIVWSELRLEHA